MVVTQLLNILLEIRLFENDELINKMYISTQLDKFTCAAK